MKTVNATTPNAISLTINALVSEFHPKDHKDYLDEINRYAGIEPISVDPDLYCFIAQCIRLRDLTNGAIDIFVRQGQGGLSHNLVELNPLELSIYLPHDGIKIDLNKIYQQAA